MIEIKFIEDQEEKTRVTLEIMNALPEWFSPLEDIANKSVIHRKYPFVGAFLPLETGNYFVKLYQ